MATHQSKDGIIFFSAILSSMAGLLGGLGVFSRYAAEPLVTAAASQGFSPAMLELFITLPSMLLFGFGGMVFVTFLWATVMSRFFTRAQVEAAMKQDSKGPRQRVKFWAWVLDLAYGRQEG
jgi:hypothetical protein